MKKVISLLLILLLTLIMVAGCSQNEKKTETTGNETTKSTTNVKTDESVAKTTENNSKDTKLFGVPQDTDIYYIEDLSDPTNKYVVEEEMGVVFGMEGYMVLGEGQVGSSFFIYAKDGKALVIKSINYLNESYIIVLQEVEKGTPFSHDKLSIVAKKSFNKQFIKYEDGTELRNFNILDKEVGLLRTKGIFKGVDGNKIKIIPEGSTFTKIYTMDGVTAESLKGLQPNDDIEYMLGVTIDTVYAVRKIEE
ncbi:MAG: hypothetical protein PWP27_1832 [Clostridiales bacterium]|jgi:hypothetical protein|nr:hypothetical protein [Clostridiales bacterium]MDK2934022.1 hypothetical protein [Clostridiales bacterium]